MLLSTFSSTVLMCMLLYVCFLCSLLSLGSAIHIGDEDDNVCSGALSLSAAFPPQTNNTPNPLSLDSLCSAPLFLVRCTLILLDPNALVSPLSLQASLVFPQNSSLIPLCRVTSAALNAPSASAMSLYFSDDIVLNPCVFSSSGFNSSTGLPLIANYSIVTLVSGSTSTQTAAYWNLTVTSAPATVLLPNSSLQLADLFTVNQTVLLDLSTVQVSDRHSIDLQLNVSDPNGVLLPQVAFSLTACAGPGDVSQSLLPATNGSNAPLATERSGFSPQRVYLTFTRRTFAVPFGTVSIAAMVSSFGPAATPFYLQTEFFLGVLIAAVAVLMLIVTRAAVVVDPFVDDEQRRI